MSTCLAQSRAVVGRVRTAAFFCAMLGDAFTLIHLCGMLLPPVRWVLVVSRRRAGQGQGQGQAVADGRAAHEERQAGQGQVQNAPTNPIREHEDPDYGLREHVKCPDLVSGSGCVALGNCDFRVL